ncbi:hypothetical protein [Streptomyces solicathayae]|uniref:Uncharacterized protein n=1 Tax=Streptomyces solicathayae TaxID=3081768 RepID=A0ABZ0LNH7_9ACTN|nr:hypothetical protein [Streptomyces sp. HUAS YS2]WOX21024.1 hypothetical protein R2D22_06340 [Streptomyces sp. HUAS YS2]
MDAQLRETAGDLARLLWREHTVYRERGGGVVIRGEHVRRWISLAPTGGKDRALLRAGRILDGGTTAPARSEVVVDLTASTAELAAVCRRLLADVTAAADEQRIPRPRAAEPSRAGRAPRPPRPRRTRHTSFGSWMVLLCVAGIVALYVHSLYR